MIVFACSIPNALKEKFILSRRYLFTSESVTEGHPDKICDQISDTILDTLLTEDEYSRVAAEVVVNTGLVLITGEITSQAHINFVNLARKKLPKLATRILVTALLPIVVPSSSPLTNNLPILPRESLAPKNNGTN
jgi:hypothetical protein